MMEQLRLIDVVSLHGDILNVHGPTLSKFVRNVSYALGCNIPIPFSRSTGVRLGIVN